MEGVGGGGVPSGKVNMQKQMSHAIKLSMFTVFVSAHQNVFSKRYCSYIPKRYKSSV